MVDIQDANPDTKIHITTVDGATYEVSSRYVGNISFLDLLKQMLKRDIERLSEE